jgi:hypothetical protein
VVEEQIQVEILIVDLQVDLLADEGEARAEFQQELADVVQKPPLELPLRCAGADREEVKVGLGSKTA